MTKAEFLRRVEAIRTGKRHGRRAPHKPLLLLLALGRVTRGRPRLVAYANVERELGDLLARFGPSRSVVHPEFPFGRLRRDGLWEIPGDEDFSTSASGDLRPKELRERGAMGGFPARVHELLASDPALVVAAAEQLLDEHFPPSVHDDVKAAAGISWDWGLLRPDRRAGARDASFEAKVLEEYRRRCAVCDPASRADEWVFGLRAARIKWRSRGGPSEVSNALALCLPHRRALDRGALGLEPVERRLRVLVSGEVEGASPATRQLLDLHGKAVRPPTTPELAPSPVFVAWHRRRIFRDPPLAKAG